MLVRWAGRDFLRQRHGLQIAFSRLEGFLANPQVGPLAASHRLHRHRVGSHEPSELPDALASLDLPLAIWRAVPSAAPSIIRDDQVLAFNLCGRHT